MTQRRTEPAMPGEWQVFGRCAYEAYCKSRGQHADWVGLSEPLKVAWAKAAEGCCMWLVEAMRQELRSGLAELIELIVREVKGLKS